MRFTQLLVSFVLFVAALGEARAFNPQPDPPGFALHAVTSSQNARLSVVNMGSSTCNVTLRMFDADGSVIASRTFAIAPGDQAALVVAGADIVPAGSQRALVRPAVGRADDPNRWPPNPCHASFLLRDTTTGATTFATTKLVRPALAQASSFRATSPLVIPNANQHVALMLGNTGEDAAGPVCQATLSFQAPGGKTVATRTVTLAPGSAATLDIAGGNGLVWGNVVLAENPTTPGWPPDPCMISYEVYGPNGATQAGAALPLATP